MALFEWGVAVHDLDFEAIRTGEKSKKQVRKELKGIAGKARTPDRQGLHRLAAGQRPGRRRGAARARRRAAAEPARRAAARAAARRCGAARRATAGAARGARTRRSTAGRRDLRGDGEGQRDREHRPQRLVLRDHLLRPLPRPDLHLQPGGGRGRDAAAAGTCASSSARRTSRAARFFHVASGNLGYQVEHHLFPDMPSTRYAEIAPQVKEICERYGLPYNSGPVPAAAGDGPADDPAPRLPGRQAAAEAGSLPGRRRGREAERASPS